jgi:hypothetical protein
MTIYVPGKVTLRQTWQPMDPDAAAYITAVETADGQALEEKVKIAIDNFVLGCKADGIWSAIKTSCILAGARTLAGALTPLVGAAPTNNNFVSGDYNRETGLIGNGSTKYLAANILHNHTAAANRHFSIYPTSISNNSALIATGNGSSSDTIEADSGVGGVVFRATSNVNIIFGAAVTPPSFIGVTRNNADFYSARAQNQSNIYSLLAGNITSNPYELFRLPSAVYYSSARLAFYSIGEALDLAALDGRVTDLITAIGVAIP